MKHCGRRLENVYRLENKEEFWEKHQETNQLVMMLQEEIVFTEYFRVYCLGAKRLESCSTSPETNLIYAMLSMAQLLIRDYWRQ
jgi:hypothetical protein